MIRTRNTLYVRQEVPDGVRWALAAAGLALLWGGISGGIATGVIAVATDAFVRGSLLVAGAGGAGVGLAIAGLILGCSALAWRLRYPWMRVDHRGVSTGWLWPRRTGERVVVAGRVGHGMVLTVGGTPILQLDASVLDPSASHGGDPRRRWTLRGVTWLAEQSAELGGMELADRRDVRGWRRWVTYPEVRAHVAWHREKADNQQEFPHLHGVAARALAYEGDADRLEVDVGRNWHVCIEPDAVVVHASEGDRRRVSLDEIFDVRVRFRDGTGPLVQARLEVLAGTQTVELLTLRFRAEGRSPRVSGLLWLADEIHGRLELADPMTLDSGPEVPVRAVSDGASAPSTP